jgi:uncharacterized protein YecE (DUF72 family)
MQPGSFPPCTNNFEDVTSRSVLRIGVYVRRHYGPGKGGNYPKKSLDRDVTQIRAWLKIGLDVYVYFNNDMGGHALRNAKYVQAALAQRRQR